MAGITKRNGTWHLRMRVPRRYDGVEARAEIHRSLRTDSEREARARLPAAEAAYLDHKGWPKTPTDLAKLEQVRFAAPDHINTLRFIGLPTPVTVPSAVTAGNGEAVRQMVLGGLGIARFSDFMIADDIKAGRLVELLPGQLDAAPLDISALYLTRVSGLRRLGVFLDWLGAIDGC